MSFSQLQRRTNCKLRLKEYVYFVLKNCPLPRSLRFKNQLQSIEFFKMTRISGKVLQIRSSKSVEFAREMTCRDCDSTFIIYNEWVTDSTCILRSKLEVDSSEEMLKKESKKANVSLKSVIKDRVFECPCGADKSRMFLSEPYCLGYEEIDLQVIAEEGENGCRKVVDGFELQHYLGGKKPSKQLPLILSVTLEGNRSKNLHLGAKVSLVGTFFHKSNKETEGVRNNLQIHFQALGEPCIIQKTSQNGKKFIKTFPGLIKKSHEKDTIPEFKTEKDIPEQPLQSLKKDIRLKNKLLRSFCRKIKGRHDKKLLILLALVGGCPCTFSGEFRRKKIHLLFVANHYSDTNTLLKEAIEVSPEPIKHVDLQEGQPEDYFFSQKISKKQSSQFSTGALVNEESSIAVIPSLSKIHKRNIGGFLEVMANQGSSQSSTGEFANITAETSILAVTERVTTTGAGGPHPKIDEYFNSGLSAYLLNNFDLVVQIPSTLTKKMLNEACNSILHALLGEAKPKSKQKLQFFSRNEIKSHLQKVKNLKIRFSESAYKMLMDYTKLCEGTDNLNRMDTLIRLTQAHAKLMGRLVCVEFDAVSVLTVVETCLENVEEWQDGLGKKVLVGSLKEYYELKEMMEESFQEHFRVNGGILGDDLGEDSDSAE